MGWMVGWAGGSFNFFPSFFLMNFIHIQVTEVRKDNNGNITCINYVACVNFPMNFALWLAVKAKRGMEMMNVLGESFVFAFRERQSFSFNFDFSPEVSSPSKILVQSSFHSTRSVHT